ncbi:ribonuclease P protein component [Flavobacteriaceae bacterium]|jgi:ribonuclease P protein component|nr:ribonuclease P protein component [Flavobacteriaceae bacterium]MDA9844116.1 ribonuclease P protein component [Flavobacteriaceae bacterium]MDA9879724.1 ribonuclease P protein component [Flavobacteriaceae bacterium]
MSRQKNKLPVFRLKGKTTVDFLFENGTQTYTKSLNLKTVVEEQINKLNVGVSVPKRSFKKAVDRNKIKRQLREAVRTLPENLLFSGYAMVIYKGKTLPSSDDLNANVLSLFESFKNKTN